MGQTAAETLSEIEAAKADLARDLDELESRLPPRDVLTRQAAIAGGTLAGTGIGLAVLITVLGRRSERRRREQARREEARINAEELAKAFGGLPDPVEATVEHRTVSSRTGPIALLVALAALVITAVRFLDDRDRGGVG